MKEIVCCSYVFMDMSINVSSGTLQIYIYMDINVTVNNVMLQLHLYGYKCK